MINEVYNRRIIELAGTIPRIGRLADPDATAKAVSRLCGSTVTVDLKMEGDKVTDFAHEVKACALGQASSSIMARNVIGSSADELRALREDRAQDAQGERRAAGATANGPISRCSSRCATTRRAMPRRCLTFDAVVDAIGQIEAKRGASARRPRRNKLPAVADFCRRAPRLAGRGLIKAYRYTLSPLVGFHCRHLPTCSDYADQAIERFGLWAGGWMTLARLLRCQPWGTHGLDFVPDALPAESRLVYAVALRTLARDQSRSGAAACRAGRGK